jgi:AAA15 family ATPase/GTPase
MIIEFSVSNYRSIKSEQTLSLVAENSKNKEDNTIEVTLANGNVLRLLRSVIIYGANASGKSNVLKAFDTMKKMILTSRLSNAGDPIESYTPFLFDTVSNQKPTHFVLTFIRKSIRYRYEFSFDKKEIHTERLDFFPKGQPANLFNRIKLSSEIQDEVSFRTSLKSKPSEKNVLKNQLYLSQFGGKPHELLTDLYRFFALDVQNFNLTASNTMASLRKEIINLIAQPQYQNLRDRLAKLIRIADTKIESISAEASVQVKGHPLNGAKSLLQSDFLRSDEEQDAFAKHKVYDEQNQVVGEEELPLREESVGTNVLVALGGLILVRLEVGGIIFFDELDNSLHPKLTKFLIRLFQNPVSNKSNAQLIFASHEVTLLDKTVFRRDQIWFTEKNKYGATELYSAKDVEGVREDIAFDKWYLSGKFGGEPRIKEVEFIFGN